MLTRIQEAQKENRGSKALVIDDKPVMLKACRSILERHGFIVETRQDPFEGRDRAVVGAFALIILDVRMPGLGGMEILSQLKEACVDSAVLMISGHATISTAVKAVKLGAFDFLPKPFTPDELMEKVIAATEWLKKRRSVESAAPSDCDGDCGLLGDSAPIRKVRALIGDLSRSSGTVLIHGETGTGKEMAARCLHRSGERRHAPFVRADCVALPPHMQREEMFGNGAKRRSLSKDAAGGTLFLDGVGGLGVDGQEGLLWLLRQRSSRNSIPRVVSSSEDDLALLVRDGRFSRELYSLLGEDTIHVPPLRERPDDLPALALHFLRCCQGPNSSAPVGISPLTLEEMKMYDWPGNVRELRSLVERLLVEVDGDTIRPEHLPPGLLLRREQKDLIPRTNSELKEMKRSMRELMNHRLEKGFVVEALRRNDWNVTWAARDTGMLRPNFHALMRKYGIRAQDRKQS